MPASSSLYFNGVCEKYYIADFIVETCRGREPTRIVRFSFLAHLAYANDAISKVIWKLTIL